MGLTCRGPKLTGNEDALREEARPHLKVYK